MSFSEVHTLWREGERRLRESSGTDRAALERVVDELVQELRRRLGGSFTAQELADFYLREGIDWCFDVAVRAAPGSPAAWDLSTVASAAYARYLRQASDFAGGRLIVADD